MTSIIDSTPEEEKVIFIAGGGTGGHLFPALTIGDYLKKDGFKDKNIIYIGSKHGIEDKYFKEKISTGSDWIFWTRIWSFHNHCCSCIRSLYD